jgi:hypothetical protein
VTATERVFVALSAARGRRIFHPDGAVFRGTLRVDAAVPRTMLAAVGERHEVVIRFSRALGTPRGHADFLGLALRLDGRQDVLLASATALPLARYVPLPARSFATTTFSSLLPLCVGDRICLIGARVHHAASEIDDQLGALADAATRAPVAVALAVAEVGRGWRRVATAELTERTGNGAPVAFDPWLAEGGIVPWGFVNALRAPAYRGSRRGRLSRARSEAGRG